MALIAAFMVEEDFQRISREERERRLQFFPMLNVKLKSVKVSRSSSGADAGGGACQRDSLDSTADKAENLSLSLILRKLSSF